MVAIQWHPPGSTKTRWIDCSPGRPAERSISGANNQSNKIFT